MKMSLNLTELQSKDWDCKYSLEKLVNHNNDLCLLDINYPFTSEDNCYRNFVLMFRSPNPDYDNFIYVAGKEDGLTCIADGAPYVGKELIVITCSKAIMLMTKYIDFMNSKGTFEDELRNVVNECNINIIYDNNYETQYNNSKKITINKDKIYHYKYEHKIMNLTNN